MRKIIIFPFIICCLKTIAQQSILRGVVSIHNSETRTGKREFVFNAQVEDDLSKAQPTLTDVLGQFTLYYVGISEKTPVSFLVKKPLLEVVNISSLNAVTGQKDLVRISMAPPDSIAEYRRRIYNIGKTEAEKRLERKVAQKSDELTKLRKSNSQNINHIKQLKQELLELDDKRKTIEEQAQDFASKYALVNMDDSSPLFRDAFDLFQGGQLDSALLILNKGNFKNMVSQILTEREKLTQLNNEVNQRNSLQLQRTQDISQTLRLKADLHKTVFEFDSTSICFELLLKLDSSNLNSLLDYTRFLAWINKHEQAINFCIKILDLKKKFPKSNPEFNDLDIAITQNFLGFLYHKVNDFSKAEVTFLTTLELNKQLAKTNTHTYDPQVASTQINLGNLFADKKEFNRAEAAYLEAFKIFKPLAEANPQAYRPYLAKTLNNLGALYQDKNDFGPAEAAYLEALAIRKRLYQNCPEIYETDLAVTQNNLGTLYHKKNDFTRSIASYLEALEIYKRLSKTNPQTYEFFLAATQTNLGTLYKDKNDFVRSEAAFLESLEICKRLTKYNPQSYEPFLALTQNNLGNLYYKKNDFIKAKSSYLESLEIRRRLSLINPIIYEPDVATAQSNLGNLYTSQKDFVKAEGSYLKSLEIRKRLAVSNPQIYEADIANTQINLGNLYLTKKNFIRSEAAYIEALSIFKQLAKTNQSIYKPLIAVTQKNLGSLYLEIKKYDLAKKMLEGSLTIYDTLMNNYPETYITLWSQSLQNLIRLYFAALDTMVVDSAKVHLQYTIVTLFNKLHLAGIKENWVIVGSATSNGNLSWYQLFARQFKEAEQSACKGLLIDSKQVWIKANLAHSLLLQGKYEEALEIYKQLKQLKKADGQTYASKCLEDLAKLENEKITHSDLKIIREFLKN